MMGHFCHSVGGVKTVETNRQKQSGNGVGG
jgi:hypothetical protein